MRLLQLKLLSSYFRKCTIALVSLIFPIILLAQGNQVSGTVLDNNGKPIAGATVSLRNKNAGTTTDEQGRFTITAVAKDALIISAINYGTKVIEVGKQTIITVSLASQITDLTDVIVIGYGTQKRSNLTSAVSQIDGKTLAARPITNAIAGLQGAAPGLIVTRSTGQPGKEEWKLNIRGFSSINGNNSPLVIIDGSPGNLTNINPNDIENISILKDAAAAAIYGAESANGVVIVTTKSGKNQKLKIDYSSIFTTNKPYNRPDKAQSWEEAEMQNVSRINAGSSVAWSDAQVRWFRNSDTNYVKNATNPLNFDYYEDIDYISLLLKDKTQGQNHNLSLSGGSDKGNYMFSLGYYDQNGVFKFGPDATKRINARMNSNFILNEKLSINSRISYTNINTKSPAPFGTNKVNDDGGLLYGIYTTRGIYPTHIPNNDGSTAGSYNNERYGSFAPYYILKDGGGITDKDDHFESVFTFKAANVAKGLTLRAIYSPQIRFANSNTILKTVPLWDVVKISGYYNQNPSFTKESTKSTRTNIQYLADYDVNAGKSTIHLLGGYQFDKFRSDYFSAKANGILSNDVPTLNFLSNPAINPPAVSDEVKSRVLISWFGKADYAFADRYLLGATYRYDQSSQLAPQYRSKSYYSVSAGWNIHSENWFSGLTNTFNLLKLRASWGRLGNSNVLGDYDYLSLLLKGPVYTFGNQLNNSIYQRDYASSQKGWETLESTNFGIDFQLLKNKLSGSFDYFIRNNIDMLIKPNVSAIFGLEPSQLNAANLESKGWEIDVKWNSNIGEFNYWLSVNVSDSRNTITSYKGQNLYKEGLNQVIEGLPINTIWGYKTDGYFKSAEDVSKSPFQDSRTGAGDIKYIDINDDKKINSGINTKENHGDLVNLGETTPHYLFGGNLGFEFKGFDVSTFIQGVGERKMMIFSHAALPYVQSWRQGWKINLDYWTPENQDAKFPRLYAGGSHNALVSGHWVQDASYVRLKNFQVGYTIPTAITEKIKISRARIYFTGQDLWENTGMWHNYYDPEQPNNASFTYPFFRSYSLGLNVTF